MTTTPISVLNLSAEATQHLAIGGFSSIEDLDTKFDEIRRWVKSGSVPARLKEILNEVINAVEEYRKDRPVVAEPAMPELLASGMTLRDHFAAKAMAALVSRVVIPSAEPLPGLALTAYAVADAMLAKRQVTK